MTARRMTAKREPQAPGQALLDAFLRKPSGTPLTPLVAGRPRVKSATPASTPRRLHRRAWPRDDIAEVRALVAAGHANTTIADRFGRTPAAVAALLYVEGIRRPRRVLSDIRCGVRPTKDWPA